MNNSLWLYKHKMNKNKKSLINIKHLIPKKTKNERH